MLDVSWLNWPVGYLPNSESRFSHRARHAYPLYEESKEESKQNARLVAMSDAQLSCLLSLLNYAHNPSEWVMTYHLAPSGLQVVFDSPEGDTGDIIGFDTNLIPVSEVDGGLRGHLDGLISVFVSELQEQLMVDVRPELQQMIDAQNEMSHDLDAIRISLQEIAANIEAENNSARLEEIANTIGLLVALL